MLKISAPVICYNFHDEKTGERLFNPSVTLEKNGVRVAFVGITDWTTTLPRSPDEVRGLDSARVGGTVSSGGINVDSGVAEAQGIRKSVGRVVVIRNGRR